MPSNASVIERLRAFGPNIEKWRRAAESFRQLAGEAPASHHVDDGQLLDLERTAGDIYEEIAIFKKLVPEVATASPNAAAELAAIGEALQLVLLDITETGTRMYSVRSIETIQDIQTVQLTTEGTMPGKISPEVPPPAPRDPHPSDEDAENVFNPSPGGDDRSEQKDRSVDRLRKDDPGSPA